jgi:hypothetical protein
MTYDDLQVVTQLTSLAIFMGAMAAAMWRTFVVLRPADLEQAARLAVDDAPPAAPQFPGAE